MYQTSWVSALGTAIEQRNLQRVGYWQETWNNNVDRMIDECYAENCVVENVLSGHALRGREALRKVEHAMRTFDGTRRMEITRKIASGNVVAVELDVFWNGAKQRGCVFLTFDQSGMIVSDHSYGHDPAGASTPGSSGFVK
jgi:hypothetical protein